ncbi:hypothetical protein [Donghicola sp. XS_ASV15]|uniref:hypothetical protein n=1 Tax=Donghicola sp. XS_ASV15 TaxID=3241295 RepID=UPI0035171280
MTLNTIVDVLSAKPASTANPEHLARASFLQWCLSLDSALDLRKEARAAAAKVEQSDVDTDALIAFQKLLVEASRPVSLSVRRRGRRRSNPLQ